MDKNNLFLTNTRRAVAAACALLAILLVGCVSGEECPGNRRPYNGFCVCLPGYNDVNGVCVDGREKDGDQFEDVLEDDNYKEDEGDSSTEVESEGDSSTEVESEVETEELVIATNVWIDTKTKLVWTKELFSYMKFNDAKNYCSNLRLDEYIGYRLPTKEEAQSIIKNCEVCSTAETTCNGCESRKGPTKGCYMSASFKPYSETDCGWMWTSTFMNSSVYDINLNNASIYTVATGNSVGVRCVTTTDLRVEKDIFKDEATDLTWTVSMPTYLYYPDAAAYCENLDLNGISDWRVPSIQELTTTIGGCDECKNTDTYCNGCKSREGPEQGCYFIPPLKFFGYEDCGVMWTNTYFHEPEIGDVNFTVNFNTACVNTAFPSAAGDKRTVRCVSGKPL